MILSQLYISFSSIFYSLVYDMWSVDAEILKTLNGLRFVYITALTTFSITYFSIKANFNHSLPHRRLDFDTIAKMEAEQEAISKKYVYEDYIQESEV